MRLPRRSRRSASGRAGGPARTGPGAGRSPRPAPAGRRGATTRAARRRKAAAGAPADESPAQRRSPVGLTGRAAVLGLVVCALVLSLSYPGREFLAQRGEIGRLQQQQLEAERRVAALEERRRQLSDPAYVRAQARKRLQYVLPGETVYVVVPRARPSAGRTRQLPQVSRDGSWYGRLWGTVRAADGASAP